MNNKAQENRNEYKTMRLLEAVGYACFRMAASNGVFDVIAVSTIDVLLVKVKSNRLPSAEEMETLQNFACPANARKLVHVWQDRKRLPEVSEIGSSTNFDADFDAK